HFLEMESAIDNFRDVGYQTMLKDLTVDKLVAAKVAAPHEIKMAFSPPDFQNNGTPVPIWNNQQLRYIEQEWAQLTAAEALAGSWCRPRVRRRDSGIRAVSRSLRAAMCAGLVPQQPPTIWTPRATQL